MSQPNPIVAKGLQDRVAVMFLAKQSDSAIARELGISRQAVGRYRKQPKAVTDSKQLLSLKATIRMEVSQENALTELSRQMNDYSEQYEKALAAGESQDAQRWSALRVRCLELAVKVVGLDKGLPQPVNSIDSATLVSQMPDEEVEARAKAILAKRQAK